MEISVSATTHQVDLIDIIKKELALYDVTAVTGYLYGDLSALEIRIAAYQKTYVVLDARGQGEAADMCRDRWQVLDHSAKIVPGIGFVEAPCPAHDSTILFAPPLCDSVHSRTPTLISYSRINSVARSFTHNDKNSKEEGESSLSPPGLESRSVWEIR